MSLARAHLHSFRQSARKVRIMLDLIRGKSVEEAHAALSFTRKQAADTLLKLLHSAVANASHKDPAVNAAGLYVSRTWADGGMMFKKLEPKAMLRHGLQKRRTCHVTIELDARPAPKRSANPKAASPAAGGK